MKVLVGYATRHGATAGIAERIGDRLRAAGLEADVAPVGTVRYPAPYDAFVIGAAAYMSHWLTEATTFVERHRELLASRPVWLFSSGPLGTDTTFVQGNTTGDGEFRLIADTCGTTSISPELQMQMGHGLPPALRMLAVNVRPSISTDVVTTVPADMFGAMRFFSSTM